MSETKTVRVRLGDGSIKHSLVEYSNTPPWTLKFSGLELKRREFSGDDLFETLTELRRELETIDAKLLCAGARADVFPSGMSRGMGGGKKAYITRLGHQAVRTDLVDIFDDAEPDAVGTVEEQRAFHQQWVQSLRQR